MILQGRIAEASDTVLQRMKSIELVSRGATWQEAQKLELAPPGEASVTQRSERQIAQKEGKLDREVKGGSVAPGDKGRGKAKDRWTEKGGEKGKDRGKGKNKDSDPKRTANQ